MAVTNLVAPPIATAEPAPDLEPPVLTGLSVSPIDTRTEDQYPVFALHFTDDSSGLALSYASSTSFEIRDPLGRTTATDYNGDWPWANGRRMSDDAVDNGYGGKTSGAVEYRPYFPKGFTRPAGTWTMTRASVTDATGRTRNYKMTAAECTGVTNCTTFAAAGVTNTFDVVGPGAVLQSAGAVDGAVQISGPTGTDVDNAAATPVTSSDLAESDVALVGVLDYQLTGLTPGASVDITVVLPVGSKPTAVYKESGGTLVDITHLVTIAGDTITAHFTDGGAGDEDGLADGVITDPMVPVRAEAKTVSVGDVAVAEGDSGTRVMQFPVTLSEPSSTRVVVPYALIADTATLGRSAASGADLRPKFGTVVFSPSSAAGVTPTFKLLSIPIFGDTGAESAEQFRVVLGTPSSGTSIAKGEGVGTIENDDYPSDLPTVSVGDASVREARSGNGVYLVVPVTLNRAATGPVAVSFSIDTAGGSATHALSPGGGADFGGALTGTIKFGARSATSASSVRAIIKIPVWSDRIAEPTETVAVSIGNATPNVALGTSIRTLRILSAN